MRRTAAVVLCLVLGGCSSFRASAGLGFGIGGSVHAGPLDVGVLGGGAYCLGNCYGIHGGHVAFEVGLPVLGRIEAVVVDGDPDASARARIAGPLPLLAAALSDRSEDARKVQELVLQKNTEIAASLYALFFVFHLGFDPQAFVREALGYANLASGGDEPDPPAPENRSFVVQDRLDDMPFELLSEEDIALVDSGDEVERDRRRWKLVRDAGEPLALVETEGDRHFDRWVEPRRGFPRIEFEKGTREALARIHERERGETFEKAAASKDPHAIAEALARFPLAPEEEQAPLLERRGELLVERGELHEALDCFLDEVERRKSGPAEGLAGAMAREAATRQLLARSPDDGTRASAWTGSAPLSGMFLGARGRSVWAMTAAGDVAWETSDVLPEGFSESKVIGASQDLMLLEAQSQNRPWVFALDDEGRVTWRTPLPGPAACASPMDQVYLLGKRALYVGRVDRVIALELDSGRVLWMSAGKDVSFEPTAHVKEIRPFDWRPEPGPPRRRPDGRGSFAMRLTPTYLEVDGGRGRRVDRFDPRTGERLHDGDPD